MFGQRMLVGVFSGLVFSGKSFFKNWVISKPKYQNSVVVSMDDIRRQLWGYRRDSHITKTEHVFKNEATRFEVKKRLIVDRPSAVFMESVMLTREAHQWPFVEMIKNTNKCLQIIQKEEAERDGKLFPEQSVARVDFKCIYFYCDLEAVRRRINYRLKELETIGNVTNASVFNLEGYLHGAKQIEIPPIGYTPLYLNTSDESPSVLAQQQAEILSFFKGEIPITPDELKRREAEALKILKQVRTL